jgi:hypothetical protein
VLTLLQKERKKVRREDGNNKREVREDSPPDAEAARERKVQQFASVERDHIRDGERMQVAKFAGQIWEMAHDLYADEPVEQGWSAGKGIRLSAVRTHVSRKSRGGCLG